MANDKRVFLYIGKERCDVLYYITKLVVSVNKSVLVIDNSKANDFYEIFADEPSETEEIRKGKIVIAKNVVVTDELLTSQVVVEDFDYVFIYEGLNNTCMGFDIDVLMVAPAIEPYEIRTSQKMAEPFVTNDIDTIIIPRDKVDNRYSPKGLIDALELNADASVYPVELDANNYMAYISLLHTKDWSKFSFKKTVNDDILSILHDFAETYLEVDEKEIKQLLK